MPIQVFKNGNERDIFMDKQSGKDFDRPRYKVLKSYLRQGDKLYVKALDRFGRNKEQILEEWRNITKEIGVDIIVMDMPLLNTAEYKTSSVWKVSLLTLSYSY